jgi:class 3 adenylate cyclase
MSGGLTFRGRVLLAMVLVVAAVTAAALLATERSVAASYRAMFRGRLDAEAEHLAALQAARLAASQARAQDVARSVRLVAAIEEGDRDLLYAIALDELREVLGPGAGRADAGTARFFRFLDARGHVLRPTDPRAGFVDGEGAALDGRLESAGRALVTDAVVASAVGWLAVGPALHQVVFTPVVDRATERPLGGLVLGFAVDPPVAPVGGIRSGLVVEGRLHASAIPASAADAVATAVAATDADDGPDVRLMVDGAPYQVVARRLPAPPGLPPTYLVGLHPLADALAAQRRLRWTTLGLGFGAFLLALPLSALAARGLAEPVDRLVAGAAAVRHGDLSVRLPVRGGDELARLATAFNEMTEGLAQKERYRSVLELVADREVAAQLVRGEIALGGELRHATVLFADIVAFTALTERMAPETVIELVNRHMTALTAVVHAHGGIVDKFIGDGLMAIFGAPRACVDDAARAVAAARAMLRERELLNAGPTRDLHLHVGIASGPMVAGCVGSMDRLSYTVLGARVNLAARLCGVAPSGAILLDDDTRRAIPPDVPLEALPPLTLAGFSAPVAAWRVVERSGVPTA